MVYRRRVCFFLCQNSLRSISLDQYRDARTIIPIRRSRSVNIRNFAAVGGFRYKNSKKISLGHRLRKRNSFYLNQLVFFSLIIECILAGANFVWSAKTLRTWREIWGQHFSFFPEHLISETLFKVAHCSGIAIDAKTFNGKIN